MIQELYTTFTPGGPDERRRCPGWARCWIRRHDAAHDSACLGGAEPGPAAFHVPYNGPYRYFRWRAPDKTTGTLKLRTWYLGKQEAAERGDSTTPAQPGEERPADQPMQRRRPPFVFKIGGSKVYAQHPVARRIALPLSPARRASRSLRRRAGAAALPLPVRLRHARIGRVGDAAARLRRKVRPRRRQEDGGSNAFN